MIAFEINGEKRIVAATTPNKVLAVGLSWTHRDSDHLRFQINAEARTAVAADDKTLYVIRLNDA